MQKKLREELWTLETDTPTMDELSSLPYLDAVVREGEERIRAIEEAKAGACSTGLVAITLRIP